MSSVMLALGSIAAVTGAVALIGFVGGHFVKKAEKQEEDKRKTEQEAARKATRREQVFAAPASR